MATSISSASELVTTGDLIIPLDVDSRYLFSVELEDELYQMSIHWNETDSAWYLDLAGLSNDVDYKGIKLVTGPNLLKPYAILELGALYIIDGDEEGLDPDYDEMGSRYQMYYVPRSNTSAII
jgi:hypothetical protein